MNALLNPEERVAIARLHAMLELLPAALDKRLGAAGITSFEYILLERLSESDEQSMRLSTLAAKTNASLPRLSRVISSLERRGLVKRSACEADGRATNAVLTEAGIETFRLSQGVYAQAVRELVLDGLGTLPYDGVSSLASLSFAILSSLDERYALQKSARQSVQQSAREAFELCAADPADSPDRAVEHDSSAAAGSSTDCAADPVVSSEQPQVCAADPAIGSNPGPTAGHAADPATATRLDANDESLALAAPTADPVAVA